MAAAVSGHQVLADPAADAAAKAMRDQILAAYGLKPWHIGLAPVPRHIRIWDKITFARRRAKRRTRREDHDGADQQAAHELGVDP